MYPYPSIRLLSVILVVLLFTSACAVPTVQPPEDTVVVVAAGEDPVAPATPISEEEDPATEPIPPLDDPELIAAAERAQELRVATAFEADSLDPARAHPRSSISAMLLRALYQTLVTAPDDPSGEVAPDLAEAWEISDDGSTVTFHLREATFADGSPVTAEDVKFSIERLQGIGGAPAYLANTIDAVEVIDDRTVVLNLEHPDPGILDKLASPAFSVLNRALLIEVEDSTDEEDAVEAWLNANSAGSGSYVLKQREPGAETVLARNEFYTEDPERAEHIVVRIVPDPNEQASQLTAGEIDVALNLTAEVAGNLAENSAVNVVTAPTLDLIFLQANQDPEIGGIASDPLVQRAIRLALDYEGIRELVGGAAVTPPSFLPQGLPEALPEGIDRDLEQARMLLDEAGYQGEEIPLVYPETSSFYAQLAEKISADVNEIDLSVFPQPVPIQLWREGNHPLSLSATGPDYIDASAYLDFLPGGVIANRINWHDDELADLSEFIRTVPDPEQRQELLFYAQELTNERGPYAFVVQPPVFVGLSPGVQGYQYNPQYTTTLARLWFECDCDEAASICSDDCSQRVCWRCRWQCNNVNSC